MSADGDDDDAQLKQLRAVWVSMREEDPPAKGLAALMAAARDKADEMKSDAEDAAKPGWWQRVLAALKRPPVLALASVAVLVGGALVIANRSDEVNKPQHAGRAPQAGLMEGVSRDVMKEQPSSPVTVPEAPHADLAVPAGVPVVQNEVAKPEPPRKPRPPGGSAGKGGFAGRDDVAKTPAKMSPPPEAKLEAEKAKQNAEPRREDAIDHDEGGVSGGLASGDAPAQPTTRAPRKKDATPQAPEAGTTTVESNGVQPDKAAQTNRNISQLIAQCESAAARNDCGAVKTLAARIKVGDAAAYKQRVIKNASIARCLEITVSE